MSVQGDKMAKHGIRKSLFQTATVFDQALNKDRGASVGHKDAVVSKIKRVLVDAAVDSSRAIT